MQVSRLYFNLGACNQQPREAKKPLAEAELHQTLLFQPLGASEAPTPQSVLEFSTGLLYWPRLSSTSKGEETGDDSPSRARYYMFVPQTTFCTTHSINASSFHPCAYTHRYSAWCCREIGPAVTFCTRPKKGGKSLSIFILRLDWPFLAICIKQSWPATSGQLDSIRFCPYPFDELADLTSWINHGYQPTVHAGPASRRGALGGGFASGDAANRRRRDAGAGNARLWLAVVLAPAPNAVKASLGWLAVRDYHDAILTLRSYRSCC